MALPRLLYRARRRRFAMLVVIGLAQAGALAAAAGLSRAAFDALVAGGEAGSFDPLLLPLALALVYLALAGLRYVERVTAEKLGQGYVGAVRLTLYDRLARLTPRSLQRGGRGGHLLRFVGDLTAVRNWVSLGLARLAASGIALVSVGAALLVIEPAIGAVFLAVTCCAVAAAVGIGDRLRAAVAESRRRRARLAGNVDEKITGMASIQVFGQVGRERRRLQRQSRGLRAAMIVRARWSAALRAISDLANGAAIALVLALAMAGGIAAGDVFAAMALLGLCLPMVRELGRVYEYWQGFRVARGNILRFLDAPAPTLARRGARRRPRHPLGTVCFDRVDVAGVLEAVTLTAAAGTHVLVRGDNGSGKSTLLALAARLMDPDAGTVRLDGIDLRRMAAADLRRLVSVVSHDVPLLRGSLRHNLTYRAPDMGEEELASLCRRCGIDDLVAADPRGLDRRIAAGGADLSLGERARVALARALAGAPAVLLLDELDAHLDAATRSGIREIIRSFSGTVIEVSHRSGDEPFDCVWKVDSGSIRVIGDGAGDLPAAA